MHAIIQTSTSTVIYGSVNWNRKNFSTEMKTLGYNVSFPKDEPTAAITIGDYKVLEVTVVKPDLSDGEKYDTPTMVIVGDVATYTYPVVTNDLASEVSTRQALVQSYWQTAVDAGFTYLTKEYDIDDNTLSIIGTRLAVAQAVKNAITTAQATFYDTSGDGYEFSGYDTFSDFCYAIIDERNRLDQKRVSLKASISDAATVAAILAIDITTGW